MGCGDLSVVVTYVWPSKAESEKLFERLRLNASERRCRAPRGLTGIYFIDERTRGEYVNRAGG
jgi:hypothetical protein